MNFAFCFPRFRLATRVLCFVNENLESEHSLPFCLKEKRGKEFKSVATKSWPRWQFFWAVGNLTVFLREARDSCWSAQLPSNNNGIGEAKYKNFDQIKQLLFWLSNHRNCNSDLLSISRICYPMPGTSSDLGDNFKAWVMGWESALGSHLNLIPERPERCGASLISEPVWPKLWRTRFLIGWCDSILIQKLS